MGVVQSACLGRWGRLHDDMRADGDRVTNTAKAYTHAPCNAIASARLRGHVHEFTMTWVAESQRLTAAREAREGAAEAREEQRQEMMEDKRAAKAEARRVALLAAKQLEAELDAEEERARQAEIALGGGIHLTAEEDAGLVDVEDEGGDGGGDGDDGEADSGAEDNVSEVSTDSEIEFNRAAALREEQENDERIHTHINFAVGLCEAEFDVEEWARNSDKAWYLGGNTYSTQFQAHEARASLYAKGVPGNEVPAVLGAGATIRIVVDLRPDHGFATFWLKPSADGLEEEVGVLEGLPLRGVALHPFVSLLDRGDAWELGPCTRRLDIEGDWVDRAGFEVRPFSLLPRLSGQVSQEYLRDSGAQGGIGGA